MEIPSPEILQYLDGRATSMLAFRKQQDVDSLATLSAKRRFFRVELESCGLNPDRIDGTHIAAAEAAGCPDLATVLGSWARLAAYAGSEARQKWNSGAKSTDLASQVPVASDWFLQSTFPDEWDAEDFLSRCESIWSGNNPTGEGMLFTRIFNYRVKMLTGYEDGLRLVLLSTTVGDYVAPLDLTPAEPEPVRAVARDLVLRTRLFDGQEPDDWSRLLQVPDAPADWAFSLEEIQRHPFGDLLEILGKPAFVQIMKDKRVQPPRTEFETYVGADQLPLYYCWRVDEQKGENILLVFSSGEFQPGRVMAHFEGAWVISGGDF